MCSVVRLLAAFVRLLVDYKGIQYDDGDIRVDELCVLGAKQPHDRRTAHAARIPSLLAVPGTIKHWSAACIVMYKAHCLLTEVIGTAAVQSVHMMAPA